MCKRRKRIEVARQNSPGSVLSALALQSKYVTEQMISEACHVLGEFVEK